MVYPKEKLDKLLEKMEKTLTELRDRCKMLEGLKASAAIDYLKYRNKSDEDGDKRFSLECYVKYESRLEEMEYAIKILADNLSDWRMDRNV